jgi:hypothetical protein
MEMSGESLHRDPGGARAGALPWTRSSRATYALRIRPRTRASTFRAAVGPARPTASQHVARAPIGRLGGSSHATTPARAWPRTKGSREACMAAAANRIRLRFTLGFCLVLQM